METGNIYIIRKRYAFYTNPQKIKVLEQTKVTIKIKNLDRPNFLPERMLLADFNRDYEVLEDLGNPELKELLNLEQ